VLEISGNACSKLSVLDGDEFATLDAGQAGSELLKKIPGAPALKGKTEARILTEWGAVTQSPKGPAPKPGSVQGISGYARNRSKSENRKFTGEFH